MKAFKPKHQRLLLVIVALIALIGAALLAIYALRNQASYFYLPEQMRDDPPAAGQAVRLGGMVEPGSLKTQADGVTIDFMVTGRDASRIPVRYAGIVPDLFVEGSGVVAEGASAASVMPPNFVWWTAIALVVSALLLVFGQWVFRSLEGKFAQEL